jgi:two-component system NtrC family sensor kinase
MSTILVLDDSMTVRMDLTEALEEAGMTVVGASTIAEARALLESERIALALLDVVLPDGDGTELLAWLRGDPRFAELPVLMLSSEADVKDRVRGLRIGASDYLGKPYDTASVIARVRQLTEAKRGTTRRTVLIVDDSVSTRMAMAQGLESAGYAVLQAGDGPEGLRMSARERPSAIIVDGVMPGMHGSTMIRRIRLDPALRSIPCLMITGSQETSNEVEALEAGADAFARKDSDIELVLARLAAMLRTVEEIPRDSQSLHAPKRVLVVDDNRTFLEEVGTILHDNGYDIAHTHSGHEAIELLAVQRVDCILLAWSVASASEVCTRIKTAASIRDTPLMVLTDVDDRTEMIEALAAGADDVTAKADGLELITARLRAQIRRREVDDERRRTRDQVLRGELTDQLERANAQLVVTNEELEAFSYSVSHDLRAPIRAISSFTSAVLEDSGHLLDEESREYLQRVVRAASSMAEMIEALLELSRVSRAALVREAVDLTSAATGLLDELSQRDPRRRVITRVAPGLSTTGDRRLVRVVFDNLLGNAWKFTSQRDTARIEVGCEVKDGTQAFYVRDNGAGFDSALAQNLFKPFKRLHSEKQFAGTGIGLATARRIVERHGGRIWAESSPNAGATFFVTFVAN